MTEAGGWGDEQRPVKATEPAGQEPVEEREREPERLWEVTDLRSAALSGLLVLTAVIVGWAAPGRTVDRVLVQVIALLLGVHAFVPTTLRRLLRTVIPHRGPADRTGEHQPGPRA